VDWFGGLVQRALLALLRLDERLVDRFDPPRKGPVPTEELPWAAALEANWAEMRAELDELLEAGIAFPDTDQLAAADLGTYGKWTSYMVHWYGHRLERNAARCLRTTALVESVPGVQIAGYTVLHPRSHVPRHQGPAKSLRYHLALKIPPPAGCCRLEVDDDVVVWEEGASLAFDDRSEHAAFNDGDEPRYVLFVQVGWPLTGWVGWVHALTGRIFGLFARGMARRAESMDLDLNPTPEPTPPPVVQRSAAIDGPGRATFSDPALEEELETFGYALAPALEPDLLESLREAHRALGAAPDDPQAAINWSFHSRSTEHKQAVKHDLMTLLGPMLDDLLDDHVPYLAAYITKWPGASSGFAPHQDPTLVDERSFRGVTIWIPLDDAPTADGRDNGVLHVVPGSHRFSAAPRVQDVDNFEYATHEAAILETYGRAVPTKAGEVLVFDNRLIHYSWPNETDEPRVVVSFTVRPRETSAVLLRPDGEGMIDLFEIPDDFYIEVLPAEQHLWQSPIPPAAKLAPGGPPPDAAEFDRLCRSVRGAPHTVDAWHPDSRRWTDPAAICHLCGSSDGLNEDDRVGRNNAQLVCARCEAELREAAQAQA